MHVKYDGDELTGLGILIRPFSSQLWMFIGVWFFLSTTIIIMTEYVIIKYLHSKERKHKPFNILDSLWTSIYVCLNQGKKLSRSKYIKLIIIIKPNFSKIKLKGR